MSNAERILVIRHGALGDFCMATGAMKAIRERYPKAHITLMTQAFLKDLGTRLGFFDEVVVDNRSRGLLTILSTLFRIAHSKYNLVYDLQGTHRTRRTYRFGSRLLGYCGRWIAVGDSDFDIGFPSPDLSGVQGDHLNFEMLPQRFALLIPGCSPSNPEKRWPAENFRVLSLWLAEQGISSVVLGTKSEAKEIETICSENPNAISFMGRSALSDIPDLARRACLIIGNDTGPTHMARLTGTKTILLLPPYSGHLATETPTLRPLLAKKSVAEIAVEAVKEKLADL